MKETLQIISYKEMEKSNTQMELSMKDNLIKTKSMAKEKIPILMEQLRKLNILKTKLLKKSENKVSLESFLNLIAKF